MKNKLKIFDCIIIVLVAVLSGMNYEMLIFPNDFAPAGINGLATIVQHRFHFEVGYMSLIINIPLLALSYFLVSKEFSLKTLLYVLSFSLATLLLKNANGDNVGIIDVSNLAYRNGDVSTILAPITAGIVNGVIYGVTIKNSGCTGGTDIVARLVRRKHPELNIMWVMFGLNCMVAGLSFFEYKNGNQYDLQPVILCIIYCFLSSEMGNIILKGTKSALKFEVVTSHADEISKDIIENLKHTATVVKATGMFTHQNKDLLICVVNKHQIVDFENLIKKYPDTFAYLSQVNETVGNFKDVKPWDSH